MSDRAEPDLPRLEWSLCDLFEPGAYALLLLNQPVLRLRLLADLWARARFRVAVDGGAAHWRRLALTLSNEDGADSGQILPDPDLISGDLDSLDQGVLEHFRGRGCEIARTPDQDYTDFTKALIEIGKRDLGITCVLAFCENSGRLDQILANIETLFLAPQHLPHDVPVLLVSSTTVSWLLRPGIRHSIRIPPPDSNSSGLHVGLIPVGEPAERVRTTGLKWNLAFGQRLAFGQLVSTSNGFEDGAECVTVETDKPLLWTQEY